MSNSLLPRGSSPTCTFKNVRGRCRCRRLRGRGMGRRRTEGGAKEREFTKALHTAEADMSEEEDEKEDTTQQGWMDGWMDGWREGSIHIITSLRRCSSLRFFRKDLI
eukprot:745999-Hanusia_phi.AAC.6